MLNRLFKSLIIAVMSIVIVGCFDAKPKVSVKVLKQLEIGYGDIDFFVDFADKVSEYIEVKINNQALDGADINFILNTRRINFNKAGEYVFYFIVVIKNKEYSFAIPVVVLAEEETVDIRLEIIDTPIYEGDYNNLVSIIKVKVNNSEISWKCVTYEGDINFLEAGEYEILITVTFLGTVYEERVVISIIKRDVVEVLTNDIILIVGDDYDFSKLFSLKVADDYKEVGAYIDYSLVDLECEGSYFVDFLYNYQGIDYEARAKVEVIANPLVGLLSYDYANLKYHSIFNIYEEQERILSVDEGELLVETNGEIIKMEFSSSEKEYEAYYDIANNTAYWLYDYASYWIKEDKLTLDKFGGYAAWYGLFINQLEPAYFDIIKDELGSVVLGEYYIKDEYLEEVGYLLTGRADLIIYEKIMLKAIDGMITSVVIEANESYYFVDYIRYEFSIIDTANVSIELPAIIDFNAPDTHNITNLEVDLLRVTFDKQKALTNYAISDDIIGGICYFDDDKFYYENIWEDGYLKKDNDKYFYYTDFSWVDVTDYVWIYLPIINYDIIDISLIETDGEYYYIYNNSNDLAAFNPYLSIIYNVSYYRFKLNEDGYIAYYEAWVKEAFSETLATISYHYEPIHLNLPQLTEEENRIVKHITFDNLLDGEKYPSFTSSLLFFEANNAYGVNNASFGAGIQLGLDNIAGNIATSFRSSANFKGIVIKARAIESHAQLSVKLVPASGIATEETIDIEGSIALYEVYLSYLSNSLEIYIESISGSSLISDIYIGLGNLAEWVILGGTEEVGAGDLRRVNDDEKELLGVAFNASYSNFTFTEDIYNLTLIKEDNGKLVWHSDNHLFPDIVATIYEINNLLYIDYVDIWNDFTYYKGMELIKGSALYNIFYCPIAFDLIDINSIYTDGDYYYFTGADNAFFPFFTEMSFVGEIYYFALNISFGYVSFLYMEYYDLEVGFDYYWIAEFYNIGSSVVY